MGFVVSFTTTENGPRETLLAAPSVAVHVTDVEPSGNVEPGSFGPQWTVGAMPLLSLASMLQVTVAPLGPVASVSLGGVTKIVGLPVSVTVTLKLVVAGGLPGRQMPCK